MDFSGAKNAGKTIWIAEADATPTGVRVTSVASVHKRFGVTGRDDALAALRGFVGERRGGIVGIDAPFSLPRLMIDEGTWEAWCLGFSQRFADAEAMRAHCWARTEGKEQKRETEIESKTPFSAYHEWMYRMTHAAVSGVLAPLVKEGTACALPMQCACEELEADVSWVVEVCPASSLKRLWGPDANKKYKGSKPEHRGARERLIEMLAKHGCVVLSAEAREICAADKGGDALDAALAAYGAWRALTGPLPLGCCPGSAEALEGRVFF